MAWYVDTSAFLKLVVSEEHTSALRSWATEETRVLFSSDLLRTEALRVARRHSTQAAQTARDHLDDRADRRSFLADAVEIIGPAAGHDRIGTEERIVADLVPVPALALHMVGADLDERDLGAVRDFLRAISAAADRSRGQIN